MVLDTQKRKQVTYFTGIEIENTCMKGQLTLFVVGIRPVEEIELLANNNKAKHIYTNIHTCSALYIAFTEQCGLYDAVLCKIRDISHEVNYVVTCATQYVKIHIICDILLQ